MAWIYKITNTVNNSIYIGCTTRTLNNRFSQHRTRSKSGKYTQKLYNSMKKYGIENFTIEGIIECSDEEIYTLEEKYIKEYDSYNNGLNSSVGGEGFIGYTHTEEDLIKIKEHLLDIAEFRKDKSYEEIYGDRAEEEKEKRSEGLKNSWSNLSDEEREQRSIINTYGQLKNSKYDVDMIIEIRKMYESGLKPKKIFESIKDKYPQLLHSDIKPIIDKRRWNNIYKYSEQGNSKKDFN